jgi:two-component system sensor histidine kinase/response regulator
VSRNSGATRRADGVSAGARRAIYSVAAFAEARDAMCILSDDCRLIDANRAACELFGVGGGHLAGRCVEEFVPAAMRGAFADTWAALLRDGSASGDYEVLRDDTSVVAVEFTAAARVAPGCHLAMLRDVTAQKAAEQLLARQRRQLVEAQSVGRLGYWEWDLVAGTIEWSDEMHRICGAERASVTTFPQVHEFVHPDDRADAEATVSSARSSGQRFAHEFRIVRPDGTIRTVESRGEVVRGDDGTPLRMFGTGQDVTERKQAEAERRTSSTVLDASDDAITACSLDGILSSWNRGAEKLYGYTAREAIGQHVTMLLPAEESAGRQAWTRILNGEHVQSFESVRITKEGREVIVAVTLSPINDAGGEIIGVAAIGRDITHQRETMAALADAHARAVQASQLKSQFMANMNHELRTPLNGVIGISSLLLETSLNDEQREYAAALRVSGDALMAVIEDILDFSKIEAGKLELANEPFELRSVVEDVCSMVAVGQPNRAVEVISRIDPALPVSVWGDSKRVRQVLTNLANNAVKFTETGEVVVHVRASGDSAEHTRLRFEVTDTGIGIDAGAQESIFESFAQADGSTTRRYGGTGLGLTIAKQLVTLMSGEIGVESAPGEGSTFWFTLPLCPADAGPPRAPHAALRGVRVLVVDDSPTNRGILPRNLERCGMEVDAVADAEAALGALQAGAQSTRPYDVALIDFRMPGTSGGELALAIKADPALTSVTVVMLVAARDNRAGALIPELDGVVTKPIREAHLRDELIRVITARAGSRSEGAPESPKRQTSAEPARRVLVAEDNPVNQLVAVRLLELRGYNVDVAANGHEALRMHEQSPYDAIFMDCQMPELDGYDTTREIRNREGPEHHTPIIAMTASTMPGDKERCVTAGMDYYSGKPINPAGLDYVLAQALGHTVNTGPST